MRLPLPQFNISNFRRLAVFLIIAGVLIGAGAIMLVTMPRATGPIAITTADQQMQRDLLNTEKTAVALIAKQKAKNRQLVKPGDIRDTITQIQLDIAGRRQVAATDGLTGLKQSLKLWNEQLDKPEPPPVTAQGIAGALAPVGGLTLPILLYHKTPPDLDRQLTYLEHHGYTVVDLDAAARAVAGDTAGLPAKPVVLTFDDGFSDQLNAFDILKRHNMKATFYIINGGATSGWCIGAGRNAHPHGECGDAYLSWDEIRLLDRSGLVTIGGHTLDHLNLASLSAAEQWRQIADSKTEIEQQLGHSIRHFTYPMGAFTQTTIHQVVAAGYTTATTTIAGTWQAYGAPFTLRRIRDTQTLP